MATQFPTTPTVGQVELVGDTLFKCTQAVSGSIPAVWEPLVGAFNGIGAAAFGYLSPTPALLSGFNVASTSRSTTVYSVVFATPMADANYALLVTPQRASSGNHLDGSLPRISAKTATGFSVEFGYFDVISSGFVGILPDAWSFAVLSTGYSVNPASNLGIGIGQTWQDMTLSRSSGTAHTNSTGKPIEVKAIISIGLSNASVATVSGVTVSQFVNNSVSNSMGITHSFVVPPGASYSVTSGGGGVLSWAELR